MSNTNTGDKPGVGVNRTAAAPGMFENSSEASNEKRQGSHDEFASSDADPSDNDNILSQYSEKQVMDMGRNYAMKHGMDPELFARAAAVARTPRDFNNMEFLSDAERQGLYQEATNKWYIPIKLWVVIGVGSMAAAVQGMDESVINGANLFFPKALGLGSDSNRDSWLLGVVNSAPYLCCATVSCWLTDPLNNRFGRKKVIFISCVISALTCLWLGFVNHWWHLFIARFFLGFGIGPKSTTVPVFSAECTPAHIRGAMVMLWQVFTAVGIMFGYVSSLAFYHVGDHGIGEGLNWRLMLGSAMIPALFVCVQILWCPESPRWLMGKNRHLEAYYSLRSLRCDEISAARDCFYQYVLLNEENALSEMTFFQKVNSLFSVRRNRNSAIGAWIVMFMQQFCGINVIAYYSSSIFKQSGFSDISALLASWGFGMINFLFAIPALYLIDVKGRRTLLLWTFPLMSVFLLMTGFSFWIPESNLSARVGVIALGIYLFAAVYSSGEGPVPFLYSAECFALPVRDVGMSFATATCWFFNFVLSLTWPSLVKAFKPQGAFGWYAAWNMVGFFLVLWFLPETKSLTLEELDEVFDVPVWQHASYQNKAFWIEVKRNIFRQNVPRMAPLHRHHRMAVTNAEWEDKAVVQHIET
ncbi:hypothetical protein BABINDRAFT_161408 [Babjeviella inositovora NRRL Y-12698]|uniref:Major facilitator superfamily (MFS) profile domain-containing protein n=1 Tax=Babjeviella inositovora NRRL Y-12698 TaxID=984486 RepID=A0A1E3QPV7_9ASCO|nr:uncharacterized protein BABINDRAFT_161408 [Babjeviella inositovora NRRL Y-12698]ODQ79690.1 hypothetical protein BABINDRAFT_161408 [Babjeviella inositovora NRRL Y-12698]